MPEVHWCRVVHPECRYVTCQPWSLCWHPRPGPTDMALVSHSVGAPRRGQASSMCITHQEQSLVSRPVSHPHRDGWAQLVTCLPGDRPLQLPEMGPLGGFLGSFQRALAPQSG